jgi:hypothetical protein
MSLPPLPVSALPAELPISMLASALPVPSIAARPVSVRCSMLPMSARLNVTELITVSMPPGGLPSATTSPAESTM